MTQGNWVKAFRAGMVLAAVWCATVAYEKQQLPMAAMMVVFGIYWLKRVGDND